MEGKVGRIEGKLSIISEFVWLIIFIINCSTFSARENYLLNLTVACE